MGSALRPVETSDTVTPEEEKGSWVCVGHELLLEGIIRGVKNV